MIEWDTVTETWVTGWVQSFTQDGVVYRVAVDPDGWGDFDCECEAFRYDGSAACKHIQVVWDHLYELED